MKKSILLVAVLATATMAFAQEAEKSSNWKYSGVFGLNANATGMINWAAGGNNNVAGDIFGKFNVNYMKDGLSWDALLDVDYGLTYIDQEYDQLQKSSDHLNFDTKLGWVFQDKLILTVNAGFHTQFDLGRNYKGLGKQNPVISNILAPSYTDISVGIDYKPFDFFALYMSPVSGRITTAYVSERMNEKYAELNPILYPIIPDVYDGLRQSLQEAYGTWKFDKETNIKHYCNYRAELGLSIKAALNYKYKDLTIMSNLSLFTPYYWDKVMMYEMGETGIYITQKQYDELFIKDLYHAIGYRDNNRRFGNFDVDWNVTLSYQFLKVLNVTLYTDLKYVNGQKIADKNGENARERVQFLGNLGLGIGYSF